MMGPLMETQKGSKYILVKMDPFTKCVETFPLKINWLKLWEGGSERICGTVGVSIGDS